MKSGLSFTFSRITSVDTPEEVERIIQLGYWAPKRRFWFLLYRTADGAPASYNYKELKLPSTKKRLKKFVLERYRHGISAKNLEL